MKKPIAPRKARRSPTRPDADNPEWTAATMARAVGIDDLPAPLRATLRRLGRPPKAEVKVPTSIRLSPDVLDHFRATGPGWQTRIDAILRKSIRPRARETIKRGATKP